MHPFWKKMEDKKQVREREGFKEDVFCCLPQYILPQLSFQSPKKARPKNVQTTAQFVTHTVKGFGVVDKAEVDVFLNSLAFSMIQWMLAI